MHLGIGAVYRLRHWTGGTMVFPGAAPGAGAADVAGWTFNPPPGWPAPPAGWQPPPDWQPDPAWPAAPAGWNFWVPAQGAMPPGALPQGAAAGGAEIRLSLAR